MSQTANGYSVIVNTLASGIAGIGFDIVPPIVGTVTRGCSAVDCSTVRHSGEGMDSPRRIRHDGSASYSPNIPVDALLSAGVSQTDVDAVLSRGSSQRQLELAASLLLSADHALSTVLRSERDTRSNPVGFSSRPHCIAATVESVTLDSIVESLTDATAERAELAKLVASMLNSARAGLGDAMADGQSQKDAAKSIGCSVFQVCRAVNSVRDMLASRS